MIEKGKLELAPNFSLWLEHGQDAHFCCARVQASGCTVFKVIMKYSKSCCMDHSPCHTPIPIGYSSEIPHLMWQRFPFHYKVTTIMVPDGVLIS